MPLPLCSFDPNPIRAGEKLAVVALLLLLLGRMPSLQLLAQLALVSPAWPGGESPSLQGGEVEAAWGAALGFSRGWFCQKQRLRRM